MDGQPKTKSIGDYIATWLGAIFLLNIAVAVIGILAGEVVGPAWNVYGFRKSALEGLIRRLPEPDATQFRNLHYLGYSSRSGNGAFALCGEINAKNKFGGYDGFKPFIVEANSHDLSKTYGTFIGDMADSYAESICLKRNAGLTYTDYDFLGKEWFVSKYSKVR